MVVLAGAGPGDVRLASEHVREALSAADVVVYDRLAAAALLELAPAGAELVDAGKRSGDHKLSQDEINATLVEHARAGRFVVRLKGGDPFLYGRGGEEAIACREAGIDFQVVPGVTSAIAVPAYAGIPVTHRGISESVTVMTGHRRASEDRDEDRRLQQELEDQLKWAAGGSGTLVVLMGLARLREIARELIRHGRRGSTPAAVISRGTTPHQQTVTGDLRGIADAVEHAGLPSPAILVVGEVVGLRDQLRWFEDQPLFGCTVVVTRARTAASALAHQLETLGAEVVQAPSIAIEPLPANELDPHIEQLAPGMFLACTSDAAVDAFFVRLRELGHDARRLSGVRVAAVGGTTAAAFQRHGIAVDIVPPHGQRTASGLVEQMSAEALYGATVLFPCAEGRGDDLERGLSELGGRVAAVPVYRTRVEPLGDGIAQRVRSADMVTFASGSSVTNLVGALGGSDGLPPAVTIGPVTSRVAREAGLDVVREADDPSIEGLVVAVLQHADAKLRVT